MRSLSNRFITIIIYLMTSSLIIGSASIYTQAQTSATNGLLASWKLNEGSGVTAFDSSGNSYNGNIHGTNWANYNGIKALEFNGISSYVDIPSLPVSNIDALSVVAWINSDLEKIGYIFYHGDTGEFLLHNGERTSDGPVAGRYPNIASFSVKLAGSTWYDVYSVPLEPDVWHQIVGVWIKGSSLSIYIDGQLANQNTAISSGYLLNDGPSWLPSLGVYNRGAEADTYYQGQLNNVMVYNRALSPQEISDNYQTNNPLIVSEPSPTITPTPTATPVSEPTKTPTPTIENSDNTSNFLATVISSNLMLIGLLVIILILVIVLLWVSVRNKGKSKSEPLPPPPPPY